MTLFFDASHRVPVTTIIELNISTEQTQNYLEQMGSSVFHSDPDTLNLSDRSLSLVEEETLTRLETVGQIRNGVLKDRSTDTRRKKRRILFGNNSRMSPGS